MARESGRCNFSLNAEKDVAAARGVQVGMVWATRRQKCIGRVRNHFKTRPTRRDKPGARKSGDPPVAQEKIADVAGCTRPRPRELVGFGLRPRSERVGERHRAPGGPRGDPVSPGSTGPRARPRARGRRAPAASVDGLRRARAGLPSAVSRGSDFSHSISIKKSPGTGVNVAARFRVRPRGLVFVRKAGWPDFRRFDVLR